MQLNHGAMEPECALVRESLRDNLVLECEPAIERTDFCVGDNEVNVGVWPRRFNPQQLAAPSPHQGSLEAGLLDQLERFDGDTVDLHLRSLSRLAESAGQPALGVIPFSSTRAIDGVRG